MKLDRNVNEVDRWNNDHLVGAIVILTTDTIDCGKTATRTTSAAFEAMDRTPMIQLDLPEGPRNFRLDQVKIGYSGIDKPSSQK